MSERDDLSPDDRRTPHTDASTSDATETGPGEGTTPVHERWWWTGAFRAVLGGVVVAYQWPILTSGEAIVWNWVLAGVGAAIVVWGGWLVLTAYRSRT
ncbi:hypothetical protein [Actinotalea sp. Marseille-Q4924]|uniref:hypothetical protein n=1 Tax=Actinotalea sp. Marseille-Q4924 TaxID=2866571 RepID=UPI001CE44E61|nr:hypothetical protein [Actinotalea sp. Marseille-Q4924]